MRPPSSKPAPVGSNSMRSAKAGSEPPALEDGRDIARLRRQVEDLQIALDAATQHGDFLQDHLYRLSADLQSEVRERQAAELKLRHLFDAVTKEKADLEILVQILIDQGDDWAEDSEKARVDGLTQIANRRGFDEYLGQEWTNHAALRQSLALVVCDVDHFKLYNDNYGHGAGDECLRQVAKVIASCLRGNDLSARYGGEEFAVVLPKTELAAAVRVGERVRAALAGAALPHRFSPVGDFVTMSIGVAATVPIAEGKGPAGLIEAADKQLYRAKRAGRDRVAYEKGDEE